MKRVLLLLSILPPSLASAEGRDGGSLLHDLPPLLERIEQHNETLRQALKTPRSADDPAPPEPRAVANDPAPLPTPQVRSDPFRVSYYMQLKALQQAQGGPQIMPGQNLQVPALFLRGIVSGGWALLEVQGSGVFLVREGDTVSLTRQGQNTVMKIEKVDRLSLLVRTGSLQEMIVVR
jgi:hypothetical protein